MMMQVVLCVGVGVLCLVIGILCGITISIFMIAKDKTVVRLREGEVVIPKNELDAMVKSLSASKKREILND